MATIIEKTGKTVEDALQAALTELGVTADDVDVEVLETPSKGIFGIFGLFGAKPARIKVTVKEKLADNVEEIKVVLEEKVQPVTDSAEIKFKSVPNLDSLPNAADNPKPEPSEENFNRDEVIERAKNFIRDVFNAVNYELTFDISEEDGNIILDLKSEDSAALIGKRGQTLDALQYLTNLAANRGSENKVRFILDVENYRARREETLQKLARSVADRVARIKQDVKLEPMSRHERRIVHTVLQDNKRVETHSVGEEPYRYIIVSPKKKGK